MAEQVSEIERLARLKRFVSPRVGDLILAGEVDDPLKTHRREITVVFTDLRGFTAFSETAEPEEVMGVLREYHAAIGRIVLAHEGTVEHFAGDGVMILFNDPLPLDEPELAAVRMALEMRAAVGGLAAGWKKRGHELGFGVGIANGYATLGAIGFEGRRDYGAIGPVTNLSARLCGEANAGQVLVSQRVYGKVEERVEAEHVGELTLKGLSKPVPAYNVLRAALISGPTPMPLHVVILAAGQGKRMHSALPKVLHRIAGRPLLAHVIDAARSLKPERIYVVHGHGGAEVQRRVRRHRRWSGSSRRAGSAPGTR